MCLQRNYYDLGFSLSWFLCRETQLIPGYFLSLHDRLAEMHFAVNNYHLILNSTFHLALGLDFFQLFPLTFCLDTKSNKKIKAVKYLTKKCLPHLKFGKLSR